ncbi:MAG: 2-oxoglutarate dehydrogenase E1 component [Chlamydiae bacterium]|nr:2-oxoglutarate dehydrogenase E1 component [Chlamydiota bacterium]
MNHPKRMSFAQMAQAEYIERIYQSYLDDPLSVESSWARFFEGMEFGKSNSSKVEPAQENPLNLKVFQLIQSYRSDGHRLANINPISVEEPQRPESLKPESYGITNLEESVSTFGLLDKPTAPLKDIISFLERVYCQKIGFEYQQTNNTELIKYIQNRIEHNFNNELQNEKKKRILDYLNRSELFESFIHTKFAGQKRFSLEGLETFIPIVRSIINYGGEQGIEELALCMAHRGRLNILTNIFERPYRLVFHEFEAHYEPSSFEGTGDVKYHKGYSADVETDLGKRMHISIPPNSSHLESVNPVLLGQVRAKQTHKNDAERSKILGIQVHGDASLAGQGVIYETMQMCHLDGYDVGGSIHIVLDNQVGFTALPKASRSTLYPSDIAYTFGCPVFHINAEDPDGCILATQLAVEVRQKFKCDVFLHLVGYRKYGHNEGDEPSYTQPLEYKNIRKKQSIRQIYTDQLIAEKVIDTQFAKNQESEFRKQLQEALNSCKEFNDKDPDAEDVLGNRWSFWKDSKLKSTEQLFEVVDTRVSLEQIKEIATKMTEIPEDFTPHKKIAQLLSMRRAAVLDDPNNSILDWGVVENLAYGSLLYEGYPIRLAGEDSRRGTFSHRHAVIVDQNNAKDYYPLNHLKEDQAHFEVYDSHLSEYGCLGFEYGYSISTVKGLVAWEAQFGDFANGAQIIIDAYLVNAEEKWNRLSNLTLLLPHGYEGQGPEHSSARIERFLQLIGDNSVILVNPTTPAQLFHLLRRQALKPYRKPLIVFTPKALLRHKRCTSSVKDLTDGKFEFFLDDPASLQNPSKLVFCSGRIYYDLLEEKEKLNCTDIAIVRLEQLYPLDQNGLEKIIKKYHGFTECFWVQEEPKNMGCWHYIKPILRKALPDNLEPKYIGRERQSASATGSHKRHKIRSDQILKDLFKG